MHGINCVFLSRIKFTHILQGTKQFSLDPECYLDAGKVTTLMSLLERYKEQGRRVLIFSQVRTHSTYYDTSPECILRLSLPKSSTFCKLCSSFDRSHFYCLRALHR